MLHIHPNSANTTVRFLSRGIFVKRVWPTISFSVHALRSLLLSIGCLFLLICIQLRYDYKMRPNNGIIHIENRSSHTRKRFVCWTVQRLKSTFDRTVIFKFIASGSAKNIMILWLMWCWGGGCCLFGSLTFFLSLHAHAHRHKTIFLRWLFWCVYNHIYYETVEFQSPTSYHNIE